MNTRRQALIGLNFGILVMTFAPISAKLIPWPAQHIILGRMGLAAPFVLLYLLLRKKDIRMDWKDIGMMALLGGMMALHWITYFTANKISTVAVAIIAVNTLPIMTTFLEPLFSHEKLRTKHIVLSIIAFAGIALMIEEYSFENNVVQGLLFSLAAALLMSLRTIWSRPYVHKYGGTVVMFWQLALGATLLSPLLLTVDFTPTATDFTYLLILAIVSTALAHTLATSSLKQLSTRTAHMGATIQPLYGIILAYLIFQEVPSLRTLLGGMVVIGVLIVETLDTKKAT